MSHLGLKGYYSFGSVFSVAQSCLTLFDPMDCSLPSSSVHGISPMQKQQGGFPFSPQGELLHPGIKSASPALAGRFFTIEPPGSLYNQLKEHELLRKQFHSFLLPAHYPEHFISERRRYRQNPKAFPIKVCLFKDPFNRKQNEELRLLFNQLKSKTPAFLKNV